MNHRRIVNIRNYSKYVDKYVIIDMKDEYDKYFFP